MPTNIIIEAFTEGSFEMAERKGIGHPDTICDEITEAVSRELCRYYLKAFGVILHHNVDKALLMGGQSRPTWGGGHITRPMSLIIAGKATFQVGEKRIPVEEIAIETAKKWLKTNIHHLQVETGIQITSGIRPGSADLVELFQRFGKGEVPLANDTSFGAGYYPTSYLEDTLIRIETLLNNKATKKEYPFIGEDVKVMGFRDRDQYEFTIAIAMIDRYIPDINDYIQKIQSVREYVSDILSIDPSSVYINTADNYEMESIYLTVTGTSAESGDDGQVGRGNRINGLITPYRPMTLEAVSGKNPVSHIGKLYNHFAMRLSEDLVYRGFAAAAEVFLVSQIGKPVTEPQGIHIRLKDQQAGKEEVEKFVRERLPELGYYWKRIMGMPKYRNVPHLHL